MTSPRQKKKRLVLRSRQKDVSDEVQTEPVEEVVVLKIEPLPIVTTQNDVVLEKEEPAVQKKPGNKPVRGKYATPEYKEAKLKQQTEMLQNQALTEMTSESDTEEGTTDES